MKVCRGLDGSLPLRRKIFIPSVQKTTVDYIPKTKYKNLKMAPDHFW